jgi:hypothetical protein
MNIFKRIVKRTPKQEGQEQEPEVMANYYAVGKEESYDDFFDFSEAQPQQEVKVIKKKKSLKKKKRNSGKKKSVALKTPSAPKVIMDAPEDQLFFVVNGPALHNLNDLINALEEMSGEQFDYHTKRNGNDFANWVRNTLGEKVLAVRIERIKNKESMIASIKKYIA